MAKPDIEVREEPKSLTLTINPKNPPSWIKIASAIKPFIQCDRKCFGVASADHTRKPSQVPEEKNDAPISIRRKKTYGREYALTLMTLPADVFLTIFDHIAQPYELEAKLSCETGDPLLLVLPSPRTWKSMSLFYVCKVFRQRAIEIYGQPSKSSLPFNAKLDKLVITDMIPYHQVDELMHAKTKSNRLPRDAYRNSPQIIRDGAHCYNMTMHSISPLVLGRPLHTPFSPKFFKLVKRVDITALSKPLAHVARANERTWGRVFHWLSGMFPHIATLSVSLPHYDNCAAKEEDGTTPARLFRTRDTWFLAGFQEALLERTFFGRVPDRLFPELQRLEVVRLQSMCSGVALFEREIPDLDAEHFLFDTGEGGWGSFYRTLFVALEE
ncbi:hypothetical protein F5Y13DRAFT_85948 [Hypoxylon sp. FL1857]|nr:hypothetical protein F5Y13DRAFT_85948 [Hypoxylon sp. FL1857]